MTTNHDDDENTEEHESKDPEMDAIGAELAKPILTTDPNIRRWIRERRMVDAWAKKNAMTLETTTKFSRTPWGDVRPATSEDVMQGAVLWQKVVGGEGKFLGSDSHTWHYVEKVGEEPGTFTDQTGKQLSVDGMLAEVATQEAIRSAESTRRFLDGGSRSRLGSIVSMGWDRAKGGKLSISTEFHRALTQEVKDIRPEICEEGVTSVFGLTIHVDDRLEHTAMRYESPAYEGSTEYDPNGLRA